MKHNHRKRNSPLSPSNENVELIRGSISDIHTDQSSINEWFIGYSQRHLYRIAYDLELLREYVKLNKDEAILEIGSIPLLLSVPVKKMGYNLTCMDLDYGRFGETIDKFEIPTIQCNIETEKFPIESNSFDLILMNEVFEHLRINPIHTFREVRRILKLSGKLYLSTPNFRSVEGIVNFIFNNKGYALCGDIYQEYKKLEDHGHMGHIREYTSREVIDFLKEIGFTVEEIIYRGETRSLGLFGSLLSKFFPSLRPFCTFVVKKGAS